MFHPEAPLGYGGERLHRPLQAGVADRVHRDVEPSLDRGRHVVVDRRERVAGPDGGAVEPGVDQRFHATVGEQLDRADPQPLVALPGGRPVQPGPVGPAEQLGRVRHDQHRRGQLRPSGEPPVDGLGGRGARGVVHARHALGVQGAQARDDVLAPAVGVRVAGQGPGVGGAPRRLAQHPRRLTRRIPDDLAAERVGGVPADAEQVEAAGADQALVDAEVLRRRSAGPARARRGRDG